jgi:hypothetical protein
MGLGLLTGVVGGFLMIKYAGALLPTTRKQPAAALDAMIAGKPIDGQTICAKVSSSDFNGAFRELDCLITFRRAFPKRGASLDQLLINKFRALHNRLRTESNDWRTVHRWKLLYILGTRMYPVQNKWGAHSTIPVYEVNGHHLAVPFWIKESKRRKLGPLFHLDTHNDMRAVPSPKDVLEAVNKLKHNRDTKNAWHTIAHAIYDCAMPVAGGVLSAGYRRVVWGKPSWNGYTEFVNRPFFFGTPKKGVDVLEVPKKSKGAKRKKLEKKRKKLASKRSHFRLYYDSIRDKQPAVARADAWVHIGPGQRPVQKKFALFTPFTLSVLTTDQPINQGGAGGGKDKFQQLLKALPKGRFTLDLDLDYFASIDSTEQFKRKAGSDPEWQLTLFKKRRGILKRNLAKFKDMMIGLRDRGRVPSLITIADSTYLTFALDPIAEGQSEYTPIEHSAFLRRQVRIILKELYGNKVAGRMKFYKRKGKLTPPPKRLHTMMPKYPKLELPKKRKDAPKVRTKGKEERKTPQKEPKRSQKRDAKKKK